MAPRPPGVLSLATIAVAAAIIAPAAGTASQNRLGDAALVHAPAQWSAGSDGMHVWDNSTIADGVRASSPTATQASGAGKAAVVRALSDGSGCYDFTLDMTDSWGDGWDNFVYKLTDAQGNLEYSGALEDASSGTEGWCLEPGYYIFTIPDSDPNGWGSEVGYAFCGISGGGVGGEETIVVNSDGTCE